LLLDKNNVFEANNEAISPRVYSINKSSLNFLQISPDYLQSDMKYYFKGMQIFSHNSEVFLKFDDHHYSKPFGCILNENYVKK